jgi:hypothetical protein
MRTFDYPENIFIKDNLTDYSLGENIPSSGLQELKVEDGNNQQD